MQNGKMKIRRVTNGETGEYKFELMFRVLFDKFEKGGWFSHSKWVEHYTEVYMLISAFNGILFSAYVPDNVLASGQTLMNKDGVKYADLAWRKFTHIHDISPAELVNYHQWEGLEPINIKDGSGRLLQKEKPLWDIAAVNNITNERILFIRTHAPKDTAFTLQGRLNTALNHARSLSAPYVTRVEEMRQETIKENPDAVLDRTTNYLEKFHDELLEICLEIEGRDKETSPQFEQWND